MERIIRVATVLGITTLVGLMSIIIANGDLTWTTVGLVVVIALSIGFATGVWAVVHGRFEPNVEIGLTLGILVTAGIAAMILILAGSEVKALLGDLFARGSAWWLIAPVMGTAAIVLLFGLHRSGRRR
ncbi:hypothetical protein H6796_00880 [Candidatus Nomurabacteria bacterium]|nr:hypothetical protein [Candidatus Nomurabacteria bacterium]